MKDLRQVLDDCGYTGYDRDYKNAHSVISKPGSSEIMVSQEGISVTDNKATVLLDRATPRNLKQLQTFLQTCSWVRKFIPDFGTGC